MTFTDKVVEPIHPGERKIVPYYSLSVFILIVNESRRKAGKVGKEEVRNLRALSWMFFGNKIKYKKLV